MNPTLQRLSSTALIALLAAVLASPPAGRAAAQEPVEGPEPAAGTAATQGPVSDPPAAADDPPAAPGSPDEAPSETVTLEPIPLPDFADYEPAVADQLRQVQAALSVLLERAGSDSPPGAAELASSFGDVGRHYHAYDLLDAAVAAYSNAGRLQPRDPRWPHLLGRAQHDAGHLQEAAAAYELALELSPGDVPALIYLAEIRVLQGDAEAAQALYRRALALEPTAAAALAGLGEAALAAEQPARAVELLEAALESNPAADRLHHPLGLAYRTLGDADSARRHLEAAGNVGIRTDDPLVNGLEELKSGERVHLLRGHMAYRAGRFGEAADAYHRATRANPESVPARVDLAAALSRLGYREGAEEQLRRALAVDPERASIHYNLGALLVAEGEATAAELHLRRAIALDPEDAMALEALAGLLAGSAPADALALYRHAQEVSSPGTGAGAWIGEVRLLTALGRYAEAVDRAEAGFQAVPSSVELLAYLARARAAAPDPSLRDAESAVDLAERYFAASQTLGSGETYALALAEAGRCDEAASMMEQLVQVAAEQGATELVEPYRERMARYRSGPPCRPPTADDAASSPADGVGAMAPPEDERGMATTPAPE